MKYRAMGRCGLKLSALGLGGWTTFGESITDAATVRTIIRAAYERGVNFFDMADAYARGEAERVMGQALRELPGTRSCWRASFPADERRRHETIFPVEVTA